MFYMLQLLPLFVVLQYSRKFLWKVRLFVITTYRKQTNKFPLIAHDEFKHKLPNNGNVTIFDRPSHYLFHFIPRVFFQICASIFINRH
jgi:hypothetical protein